MVEVREGCVPGRPRLGMMDGMREVLAIIGYGGGCRTMCIGRTGEP